MSEKKLSRQILTEAEETLSRMEEAERAEQRPQKRAATGPEKRPGKASGFWESAPNQKKRRKPVKGDAVHPGEKRLEKMSGKAAAASEPAAPQKSKTPCPYAKKCGGCQLQNLDYPGQLRYKQRRVEGLLGKFHRVRPILAMEDPWHYRNKVQAAFGVTREGKIVSGVYQSSTHRIVPLDSCMIEDRQADAIIVTIRKLLKDFKLTAYDEYRDQGLLRHVLVKRGFATGEIMVVLVTSGPIFPAKRNFVRALLEKHPEITTVIQNINPGFTSLVLGERENVLYGRGYIEDILCGCRFRISARSFYQVNPVQTEKLYHKAIELAELTGEELVVDAYCGIGTIGIVAGKQAKAVVGAELNPEAVRDAEINAKLNHAENIHFVAEDAGEFMEEMASAGEKADVVFMDPPRAGSDERFLSSLVRLSPEKVVYISCNPETQARDLTFLVQNGYRVKEIQPVDMFPHTAHVETVVLMSRVKG